MTKNLTGEEQSLSFALKGANKLLLKVFLILVTFYLPYTNAKESKPPSQIIIFSESSEYQEVKKLISSVFEANIHEMAGQIRQQRPIYDGKSDEYIFSTKNCEPASKLLKKLLDDKGLKAVTVATAKHFYLTLQVSENGNPKTVIVDPTYRQLYFVFLDQKARQNGSPEGYFFNSEDFSGMPLLLIVPENELKDTLESFPLKPEWNVDLEIIGYLSTFEDWYDVE